MRKLLERKFFPFVMKPGRYTGGEPGQIVKDPEGRVSYLHAYADKYEVGQSYVGLQSLYHIINQDDRFLCERVYAVDLDAEAKLREGGIPLFSLESSRPVKEFDALGFTLVDETVYTNVLAMIDLSGMALRAADREDSDPIIMAGGPAVYNPEPLAPFIDLFFIGDGEEGLPEMLGIIHEMRGKSKEEILRTLATKVESVYIPCFYDDEAKPVVDFAPATIKARLVPDLKPEYYPTRPILPLVDTVHNHLGVEIMRGCPQGCKFCFAGPIYRPVRPRSVADIAAQVEAQIEATGYTEVTPLSLSSTDYPHMEQLLSTLSQKLQDRGVSLTLPSFRPGSVTAKLLDSIRAVRKSGLTMAPEAGTERLRLFIRKDFPDAAIYDTARLAFSKGWTSLKLYFMVGLPSETTEDLMGISNICRRVYEIGRKYGAKANINVTLSPFVPKAHTPFQWDESVPEEEIFEKIKFIKRNTRIGQIHFKHNNTQLAMLAALLGRGSREMADVIEAAYRKGARFDSWGELFEFNRWLEALAECKIDSAERLKPIPFDVRLPWSFISKGPSVDHLIKQRQETSRQLAEFTPQFKEAVAEKEAANNQMTFGRGTKRVASRSQVAPTKNKVRVRWGKTARYRYMSHLENLRLLERALRRSRLPVSYSQGYNPTMKLSLGPPLPLGFTSEAEYLDITLDSNLMPYMVENLRKTMPEGIDIIDARSVFGKNVSLNAALNRVEYTLPVKFWSNPEELRAQADEILGAETLECVRKTKSDFKKIDIRPALYDIRVTDKECILELGLGTGGYAKPAEVTGFLDRGLTVPTVALPFHRKDLYRIDDYGNRIEVMDL